MVGHPHLPAQRGKFSVIGGRKPAAIGLVVCAWQAVRLSVRSRL